MSELAINDLHVFLGDSYVVQGATLSVGKGRSRRNPRPQRRRQDDAAARHHGAHRPGTAGRNPLGRQ